MTAPRAHRFRGRSALLEELFEQTPNAAVLMSVEGRVVQVNREFTRIFSYTAQESHGQLLSELITPGELLSEFQDHINRVLAGERVDTEVVRHRKDGGRLHLLAVGFPITGSRGNIAMCVTYRDITERKAVELSLQTLPGRLLEVQEAERRHLARELHDEIGQLLTGLRLLLRPDESAPDAQRGRIEQARAIADDLVVRIRRLSFDLRPADLDELGLLPALLSLFERYTVQTGVLVDFKHQTVGGRFSAELETGAYRIVQETLTNAARHAGVAGVSVRVYDPPSPLMIADVELFNIPYTET